MASPKFTATEVEFPPNLHTLQDATTIYKLGETEQWASQWVRLIVDRHRIKLHVPNPQYITVAVHNFGASFTSLLPNLPNFLKRFQVSVLGDGFYPTFLTHRCLVTKPLKANEARFTLQSCKGNIQQVNWMKICGIKFHAPTQINVKKW